MFKIVFKDVFAQNIVWQPTVWAYGCRFKTIQLSNASRNFPDCTLLCFQTTGCTHYEWNSNNGGTCTLKSGPISINDAVFANNTDGINTTCGVISKRMYYLLNLSLFQIAFFKLFF